MALRRRGVLLRDRCDYSAALAALHEVRSGQMPLGCASSLLAIASLHVHVPSQKHIHRSSSHTSILLLPPFFNPVLQCCRYLCDMRMRQSM
eukprot:232011-Chlamydomonas_euryale.AAC.1